MYGPTALQVNAGNWEHEALREAKSHRRGHTDTDYLTEMEHAHQRRSGRSPDRRRSDSARGAWQSSS